MAGKCFMVQPFDSGKFDKRFDDVFAPAVTAAGLKPYRVDRDPGVSVPIDEIEKGIREATAVFVDLTADNPNVWFELGFAIAVGKDLCLVCSSERTSRYPFDIQHRKIIPYAPESSRDFEALGVSITERLKAIQLQQEKRADIRAVTVDHETAGLSDFEAAALACVASEAGGPEDTVSHWSLQQEMEKAGFNKLACNVAVRGLRAQRMLEPGTIEGQDGPMQAYAVTEVGWDWITSNTHKLSMKAPEKRARGGFDKKLDTEIPF